MIDSGIEAGDLDDQFIQMDMNDDERMKLDLKKKVSRESEVMLLLMSATVQNKHPRQFKTSIFNSSKTSIFNSSKQASSTVQNQHLQQFKTSIFNSSKQASSTVQNKHLQQFKTSIFDVM